MMKAKRASQAWQKAWNVEKFHPLVLNEETSNENRNSKVRTIKILLDSVTIVSIVRKDVLYERHRILKD